MMATVDALDWNTVLESTEDDGKLLSLSGLPAGLAEPLASIAIALTFAKSVADANVATNTAYLEVRTVELETGKFRFGTAQIEVVRKMEKM
ncbi:hypothetical protein D9619_005730 [Psilocybe cf. subviscida]|uniref:Uncharacterized protein n=1 Tax=Psilocybe cf. subviscida TaxID=2480587 RepID=A0A8H5BW08_9AGAR|nr:hypothetical protein D9619_005730 [Psilocybe cf. subviscida]